MGNLATALQCAITTGAAMEIASANIANNTAAFAADPSAFEVGASEYVYGAPPITQAGARDPNFRMARLFSESSEIKFSMAPASTNGPGSADGVGAPPSSGSGDDGDGGTNGKKSDIGHDFDYYGLKVRRNRLGGVSLHAPKGAAAIPLLLNAINDANIWTSEAAFRLIAQLGEEAASAVPVLAEIAADTSRDYHQRMHALETLQKLKGVSASAVDALMSVARDPSDEMLSAVAMDVLGKIGVKAKKALSMLRRIAKSEVNEWTAESAKEAVEWINAGLSEERLRAKAAENGHFVIALRVDMESSYTNKRYFDALKEELKIKSDRYSLKRSVIVKGAGFFVVESGNLDELFEGLKSIHKHAHHWDARIGASHAIISLEREWGVEA